MIEDGVSAMMVLGATKRDEFDTDEAYITNALASFAKTIERYGPGGTFFADNPDVPNKPVIYYQILNEPNFQYMYKGTDDAKMIPIRHRLYARLLPRTYAMIKKRWPTVNVVGWTCGGAAAQDLYFVDNALKINPAMATSFDVFSTHPYMAPAPPEAFAIRSWGGYSIIDMLGEIRRRFAQAGRPPGTLPVWYTEGGWRLKHEDGGMHPGGEAPPLLHAAYYVRYYAIGLGVFNRTTGWKRDNAKPWRPAAYAIQTMIRLMPNPKLKRIIVDGDDGVFAYEFLCDKRDPRRGTTVMAWKVTGGGKALRLPVSYSRPVIVDMLGAREPATATVDRGAVTAVVGPYPIYVSDSSARKDGR